MITGNLEYLLSSLPYLSFQDTKTVRSRVFYTLRKYAEPLKEEKSLATILDDEAAKFLKPSMYNLLRQIKLDTIHSLTFQQNKNSVLAAFSKYAFNMKEDIKRLRMSRGNDSNLMASKIQPLLTISGNPLDEEIQLLKLKWDKLETLSVEHNTGFSALIIYKLKLMLLLRMWSFDMNKGFEVFLQTIKAD